MLNFSVGPVQSSAGVRAIGAEQVPYFRTPEFSKVMLENEAMMKELAGAPEGSRAVFLTGSGTASMEAAVMNCFTPSDRVLVVNGGSFGERFAQICAVHGIPHTEIRLPFGKALKEEHLAPYEGTGYTGFLVNVDETSSGVLYDLDLIGAFCRRNGIFLICDCISSFLTDPFCMKENGAAVMITGSQKALACPPGISVLVLSPEAVARIEETEVKSLYFDLKSALKNMDRGQTPFTPAVGILLQIHERLTEIMEHGGAEAEIARCARLSAYFRERIGAFPFTLISEAPTNAVTTLGTGDISASGIFRILKDVYGIWVCPNGGKLAEKVFRVGHLGDLNEEDYDTLLAALADLQKRGLL